MTLKVALIGISVKRTGKHVQNSLRGISITAD